MDRNKNLKTIITFLSIGMAFIGGVYAGIDAFLTFENDAIAPRPQDNDYTHGTKIELVDNNSGFHYMLSQTMYAPSDLTTSKHIVGDRPYCGMALFGVGHQLLEDEDSPWSHYAELNLGVIGPSAKCKETQRLIHKWLGCKEPMGWDNQLHDEFVVNVQYWLKYNWYICKYVALVPRMGIAAGTIQDFADIGVDLKIGYNIAPVATSPLIFSVPQHGSDFLSKFSCYVFAGVGERYYLYNHILQGSMFSHKDDGLDVSIEPFVTEFRCGIVFSYDRFFSSYYCIFRTDEFKHQPNAPDFGGICIGWRF